MPISSCGDVAYSGRTESRFATVKKNEWVFSAISTRARAFSGAELQLWKKTKGMDEDVQVYTHPILNLLKNPNPAHTLGDFLQTVAMQYDIFGESILFFDEAMQELIPVNPQNASRMLDSRGFIDKFSITYGNTVQMVDYKKCIHIKNPSPVSMTESVSAFDSVRETVESDNFASMWNRKNFDGTAVEGLILSDNLLTNEEKTGIVQGWRKIFSMFRRKSDVGVLDGGMKYQQVRTNPKDMDFANLSDTNKKRILALYGVPLALLGNTEGLNRDNIFGIEYFFEKYTVSPLRTAFLDKMNAHFVDRFFPKQELYLKFSNTSPEDEMAKNERQKAMFSMGALTPNEVRAMDGREAVKGGDTPLIPFSLSPLGETKEPEKPEPVPAPKKEEEKKSFKAKKLDKEMIKKSYITRFDAYENFLEKKLVEEISKQEKKVLSHFSKKSIPTIDSIFDVDGEAENFFRIFDPILYAFAVKEGEKALEEIGFGVSFQEDSPEFRKAISEQTMIFSKQVSKTTEDGLKEILQKGITDGVNEYSLYPEIQKVFTGAKGYRARAIARTETLGAVNTAHKTAYTQAGVEKKEWLAVHDGRTRPNHSSAGGQVVAMNGKFTVGGYKMDRPGDKSAPAIEVVNCRCRLLPVIE